MIALQRTPLILFGAFDRHNFGDLLFPHLMMALLPGQTFAFAGLAERDLTAFGGHRVRPLANWNAAQPAHLLHVGGELLTCTAWQAAVMLLDPAAAATAIARYGKDPQAAARWAAGQLGTPQAVPYVAGRGVSTSSGRVIFNAVGGVEWPLLTVAQKHEVGTALRRADWISVRDHLTQAALRAEGIEVPLCPDPAVMVAECCRDVILRHQDQGEVKKMREAFPQGYLACQFSADFADDTSLDALARGVFRAAAATGLGVVLFCAGVAPWHDDPRLYENVQSRLPHGTLRIFTSLHLWDICALIAASRGVVTSSLHGRIVALAYGLPRVSLIPPQQGGRPDKRAAFAETWEPAALPPGAAVHQLEAAVTRALSVAPQVLRENAAQLRAAYLSSQAQWADSVTGSQ